MSEESARKTIENYLKNNRQSRDRLRSLRMGGTSDVQIVQILGLKANDDQESEEEEEEEEEEIPMELDEKSPSKIIQSQRCSGGLKRPQAATASSAEPSSKVIKLNIVVQDDDPPPVDKAAKKQEAMRKQFRKQISANIRLADSKTLPTSSKVLRHNVNIDGSLKTDLNLDRSITFEALSMHESCLEDIITNLRGRNWRQILDAVECPPTPEPKETISIEVLNDKIEVATPEAKSILKPALAVEIHMEDGEVECPLSLSKLDLPPWPANRIQTSSIAVGSQLRSIMDNIKRLAAEAEEKVQKVLGK
jgi:hypothetical protein